jgi:CHAT domain-containing protein/tetratricopeptide (TPR) repeat protein
MKYGVLFLLAILTISASSQAIDSMAIKQVDSLILVSREFTAKGDFVQALEVNNSAEKLALEKLGKESAAYGNCAFNRGRINYFKRDYPEAEKWYLESKSIREKVVGTAHTDYAWSLNNLGILYADMGKYEQAEPFYLESKAIRKTVLGTEHPDYAGSLVNLAILYNQSGKFEKAEPLYLEAKALNEKLVGKEHQIYASSVNSLAILYDEMGHFHKAEALHLEASAIRQKVLGKDHPIYAQSLNNLASLYWNMGKYEQAEPLFLKAIEITKKSSGKEHGTYAQSLGNLAVLYKGMGNYEKAEPLYHEALEIQMKIFGKEHPIYAQSLSNLASLYRAMGKLEKAESFYFGAMEIQEKKLGKEHPVYAMSVNNLASLYWNMGQFEKAEPLHLEAKSIIANALGKEGQDYAYILNSLAILYASTGDHEKAEQQLLEAKSIHESLLGKEHPVYGRSLFNLTVLYMEMGHYQKAEPFVKELSELNQTLLEKAVGHLSERELDSYLKQFTGHHNQTLSFATLSGNEAVIPICYDNALFYKGFLLQAAGQLKRLAQTDPVATDKFNFLQSYQRRLASQFAKPIPERDRNAISDMLEKVNDLEKDLARTVVGFGNATRQVNWKDVQTTLRQGEMAIEFIHYDFYHKKQTDSTLYAALVILPGANQPKFIPLFEENEFDHLLKADVERKADYVNELYAWADRGMVKLGSEKKSLYDLIWAKIEATGLEDIKTVYYSPSGVLHRLNLGAIAIDDETILSDRYNLVALNSTRQLVIPATITTRANDALLVGGVNFEVESTLPPVDDQPLLASRSAADAWTESGTRGGSWSYLKWTEKEVDHIASTLSEGGFNTAQSTGSEATEETIKMIGTAGASPRVLHIATHGFFFPDPEIKSEGLGLGEAESVFKMSENPMIRSGLIMGGGNYAWQHGRAVSPDKEDGILTAYEISQMNLSNTELVVLSACETGLGDIKGNEGVYGLQRAFKVAGAKYLIMSLWQVPDRETMEFMTTFYRNWLEEKLTMPDAFRKTQREMRDRFYNPYSWAGFVLVE